MISSNSDGKAVVQWGTIITPPTTEANASLVLKMDAKDFKVPNFDIAVQPGFADSLSSENVLTNGFNKNDQNQMALLQRTMKVVSDVNGTLLSASDQINELRKNLDSTAGSLGNGTAENLKGSNEKLTKRMEELSNQIRDLKTDLSKTAQTNNSQLITQLERTVGSLDSALGDTSVHPSVRLTPAATPARWIGQPPMAAALSIPIWCSLRMCLAVTPKPTQDASGNCRGPFRILSVRKTPAPNSAVITVGIR